MKYFVLGAFSSAFFLYGIALVYGATGSTSLGEIATFLGQHRPAPTGVLLAGIGAAPRRPRLQGGGRAVPLLDARRLPGRADAGHRLHGRGGQGGRLRRPAPRPRRRLPHPSRSTGGRSSGCSPCSPCSSASVLAIVQTDVKRMLAYSSISHAGYVLVGVQAASAPTGRGRRRSSTCWPTPSWSSAASPWSPSSGGTGRGPPRPRAPTGACRPGGPVLAVAASPSSCWPRPACRSRPASSPSST